MSYSVAAGLLHRETLHDPLVHVPLAQISAKSSAQDRGETRALDKYPSATDLSLGCPDYLPVPIFASDGLISGCRQPDQNPFANFGVSRRLT
jgi:hypothetical protein